jgi:ubiquinone/menaquinone biosynthesis C-methylase UbiE
MTNHKASEAFTRQSIVFDEIYAENEIIAYKRHRTRNALEKYLSPKSKILELNAGTGQDAVYFAQKGHHVHSTDISEGMLAQLKQKVVSLGLSDSISFEEISFEKLEDLQKKGQFDAIFSNFGGLNCTNQLDKVLSQFSHLLNPEGIVTLVIMPHFCLWEFWTVFKGNFKLAFRRFFSKNGAKAHLEGVHFLCWYYQPSYITRYLKNDFDVLNIEGLCTLVPPSYMETFPNRFPRIFAFLQKAEDKLKSVFPFKYIGDYFIITLKKKML